MRERLGKALVLLQATSLPPDLIDNPARTGQWLAALGNLQQAVVTLRDEAPPTRGEAPETRSERVMRAFNRMIDGLPTACLNGVSPVIKLGLIRPLLTDLEAAERRILGSQLTELSAFTARLTQCRVAAAAMAARHIAPDPPPRRPVPAAATVAPTRH
jgi:hypothetical protein